MILALHRSGSSAVAGVLDLLGVDMGDNLLPATPANPKVFFENIDVILLNGVAPHRYQAKLMQSQF